VHKDLEIPRELCESEISFTISCAGISLLARWFSAGMQSPIRSAFDTATNSRIAA
jgi:hypothetical protein